MAAFTTHWLHTSKINQIFSWINKKLPPSQEQCIDFFPPHSANASTVEKVASVKFHECKSYKISWMLKLQKFKFHECKIYKSYKSQILCQISWMPPSNFKFTKSCTKLLHSRKFTALLAMFTARLPGYCTVVIANYLFLVSFGNSLQFEQFEREVIILQCSNLVAAFSEVQLLRSNMR